MEIFCVTCPIFRENFRFEDKGDNENDISSILSSVRAWTSDIFAGKCDNRRHSTMGFSKNVLMAETSYQMLEDLSFCELDS